MSRIRYLVRARLRALWRVVLGAMAEIPVDKRITFSGVVTLGNILTIVGGMFIAATLMYRLGEFTQSINSLRSDVAQIKCDLAAANIGTATTPCTFRGGERP